MIVNSTCFPGNDTVPCPSPGSPAGLAVGLTLFFLLLGVLVGVMLYKYHRNIRDMLQFRHRRSLKKEDFVETQEADPHQYISTIREQSISQTPIYENLTRQTTGYNRRSVHQSRSSSEPQEDLYLQCDLPDDAIYSNDPACNLSILPDSQEEDVYIMPDSL